MDFNNNVLILGYGAVSKCVLPILPKHLSIPWKNITVLDFEDKEQSIRQFTERGVKFYREKIEEGNLNRILSSHLKKGDLLIDLAWNIGCDDVVKYCHNNDILYINTSVEQWDPEKDMDMKSTFEKTLYYRHMSLRNLSGTWTNSATAIVEHGANPGLISHWTKQGLIDIAYKLIEDKRVSKKEGKSLEGLVDSKKFPELSMKLGVKVIHCSEKDTQISNRPVDIDEFVGTWSIEGFREEGTAPAEMGWGTHEKYIPENSCHAPYGPQNQIFLNQMGINTYVRSWIPDQEIIGMVVRHGEAFGISERFTIWEGEKEKSIPVYRPTVHYAYMPCPATLASLWELRARNGKLPPRLSILNDSEIKSGADILGALIMGHKYNSWWTGSILDIEESRKLNPGQNATTIQVALGVISAAMWAVENPRRGVCLPDDLPHDYVLKIANPYLGRSVSKSSDWTPLKKRTVYFKENKHGQFDNDIWQFNNFLFVP